MQNMTDDQTYALQLPQSVRERLKLSEDGAELQTIFQQYGDLAVVQALLAANPSTPAHLINMLFNISQSQLVRDNLAANPNLTLPQFMTLCNRETAAKNPSLPLYFFEDLNLFDRLIATFANKAGEITVSYQQQLLKSMLGAPKVYTFQQLRKTAARERDDVFIQRTFIKLEIFGSQNDPKLLFQKSRAASGANGSIFYQEGSLVTRQLFESGLERLFRALTRKENWFLDMTDGPAITDTDSLLWYSDQKYSEPRTFQELHPGLF